MVALVLGVMIPFAMLALVFILAVQAKERRDAETRLTDSAILLAEAMDREFDAAAQVLETLARSQALASGDLAAFHALAVQIRPERFSSIALVDADMTMLLNTRRPFGTALPRPTGAPVYREALEQDRLMVGNLVIGAITGTPVFAIAMPVAIGADRRGLLLISLTPARMQTLLERLPSRYLGMISDRSGMIVARTQAPEAHVGRPVRPELQAMLAAEAPAFTRLTSGEGQNLFVALHRSPQSGWAAVVAQDVASFHRTSTGLIVGVAALSLLLFLAGLAAARILSRRLVRSLEDLAQGAERMGREQSPLLDHPAATREIATVAEMLARSHALIEARSADLRQARIQAERAGEARSRFLAYMSHELRTPLTAVLGFSEALRMGIAGALADRRQDAYVRNIETAGRHLLSLIDDILDLAKIDAGQLTLVREPVDLREVVGSATTLVGGLAAKRAVRIGTDLPAPAPVLQADRRALLQILVNLLSNAAKFAPEGSTVQITARVTPGMVTLTVRDDGPGMTEDEVRQALTPFRQGVNAHVSDTRGTGLGLPLAKRLAELQGGGLTILSASGRGTLVTLTLPCLPGEGG
jgi:two-component system cell cycle sensor histidine kinase PleC